jgi:hypothetical protein
LDRSYEALVDKAEVLKAAAARNQAGLRLWCGISAANDAFVHAEEGQALESTMRTLFTVGLEDADDDDKEEEEIPEETLFTACSQKQKHPYHVLPRVEYRIIPGGHATSMLSAPITLVPEIVRMVDRLADYAPMQ